MASLPTAALPPDTGPLVVLAAASAAALATAVGSLALVGREQVPRAWIGWANALAGGLMLGAAFLLSAQRLADGAWIEATGAVLGIAFTFLTHAALRTADLDLNRVDAPGPTYGYRVLLTSALHSASEGLAVGVGMAVDLRLGLVLAAAIAVHNAPEGTILAAVLRGQGASLAEGAALGVGAKVSQVLLAVTVYAVAAAAPAALPWLAGFAVGALVHLVLMELLPEAYREAGGTSIAVVASVALSMVVLAEGFLL